MAMGPWTARIVVDTRPCKVLILAEPYFTVPFLFYCSGGLRLKRDITEYGDFVRSFNAPSIDEKFEQLGM
jgi:hypothetical protein